MYKYKLKRKNSEAVWQLRLVVGDFSYYYLCYTSISVRKKKKISYLFVFSPEADFLEAICWFPMVFYTVGSIDK